MHVRPSHQVRGRQVLPPGHEEQQRDLCQQPETEQRVGGVAAQGGLLGGHPAVRRRRYGELEKGIPSICYTFNQLQCIICCRVKNDVVLVLLQLQIFNRDFNPQVTHGCIIATLKLFLPDGKEAKASPTIMGSSLVVGGAGLAGGGVVPAQDLYQLNTYIQVRLLINC